MLTIHLRINDAASGQPTPVRMRVTGADGTHFAPLGRFVEFPIGKNEAVGGQLAVGRERWSYINGACEIPLPSGVPLRVQATKGPAFRPLDQTVTLGAGQMALRFAIERWCDTRADGWVSVDTRCHFLTPHDALLEAAAEGVDVVNLLATQQAFPSLDGTAYPTAPNLTAFSGQVPALERDGTAVIVNTFNTHPVLGKVALLHTHRPVFPLTFGGEETDDWGVCDWCDQAHRKRGLVVWVDAFEPAGGITGGEALVAAILGKIDAIEVSPASRRVPLLPWVYRLWDAGVFLPLVGASGKDSNRGQLGSVRTFANGSVSWVEAIRNRACFTTAGPLLDLTQDGARFRLTGQTLDGPCDVELVANGRVVASGKSEVEAEFTESGWVAGRCAVSQPFAHTSPIIVANANRNPDAVAALGKLIAQTREWATMHGRCTNPKRRDQLLAHCDEALTKLGAGV